MADVMNRAANLKQRHEATVMLINGAFQEAEPNLRLALEETADQHNAQSYMWMQRLAECLIGQGKCREAEPLAKSASLGYKKFGQEDEDFLDCKYLLAECLQGQKKNSDAEELALSVLKALERNDKRGPEHPTTLKCRALYAKTLKSQCKFKEANAVAKQNQDYLEAIVSKAQAIESSGSRRLTHSERKSFKDVDEASCKMLGEPSKLKRISTIETQVPDDDDMMSRLTSKDTTVSVA